MQPDSVVVFFPKPPHSVLTERIVCEEFCMCALIFCRWPQSIPCFLWKSPHAAMVYPARWKCKVPKPLGLVRYRLALSAWALKFYDDVTELVISLVGEQRMSEWVKIAWLRETGVETELSLPLSRTARGALQKLLSYTYICMASQA